MIVYLGLFFLLILMISKPAAKPAPKKAVASKSGFVERFKAEAARANMQGVSVYIALTIAALETGWGTGGVFKKTNNLFNLKAVPSWTGKVYPASDGGAFRIYDSWADCMNDWAKWFSKSNIFKDGYRAAVGNKPAETFRNLQAGGYAGADTAYYSKLVRTYEALV